MQRKAGVPVVFISSTSEDLRPYREAAREAAIAAGLLPVMMEYFPATGRPSLPECLCKISKADVVVVIVAHRYGWVPPNQPPGEHKSITWLECEQAEQDHKLVLPFLIDPTADWPVQLKESYRTSGAIDDGTFTPALAEEVQRNIANLAKFKDHLNRTLRATFRTPDDLHRKIEHALREWRGEPPTIHGDPAKYLDALRQETAFIDIRGLQVGTGKAYRFPIEDLYIPLTTSAGPGAFAELAVRKPAEPDDEAKQPRFVITGDPGSGKTTFLRNIAYKMCEDFPRAPAARLPILIRIAELAEHVRACRHRREGPTVAAPAWLPHWLAVRSAQFDWGLDEPFFERKLKAGEAAVLLDGLDEAPNRTEREAMARLLENATRAYDKCSFVVTTRPLAYQGQAVLADFETANIAPLEPQAIEAFLQRWCGALFSESPASSASHLAELSGALRAHVEIRRMARNPVMLTSLAVVHWNERRLPEQRADLYESILIWLARSREQRPDRPTAERCLMLLQQLALAMQNAPKGRAVQVSKGWAADALAPHFREVPEPERLPRAQDFLEQEEIDSGIIVSRASDISFPHLTFQEYLTAKAVAGMADAAQQVLLLSERTIYKPEWREVLQLLGGVLYRQGLDKVDGLVSTVLEKQNERPSLADQARCAGLLGAIVRDLQPFRYQPTDPRYHQTMDAVLGIFDADTFQIGRYPVTVEEYRRFVEDEGYQNKLWWRAGGFGESTEPGNWDEQVGSIPAGQ